jgi:Na+-transporting NADH:ubiquinone oxidoreductase subunit F
MSEAMTSLYENAEKRGEVPVRDYSLTGVNAQASITKGLAEADWYRTPIDRKVMKELLERKDGPAIRDTLIWFGLLALTGTLGAMWWGSAWAILPFAIYGVIYASSSDSRWHESSHGTAFKTDWMNNALYEIASFMVFRESTPWRWSHTRHHSDTIIIGRDPEVAVPRPTNIKNFFLTFVAIPGTWATLKNMLLHATGRLTPAEASYIPENEHSKVYYKARIYLLIYMGVIGLAVLWGSWLPLMYIGLPTFYGSWLMPIYGFTQHAGLAENVLDHRLNCRTVYMSLVHRYLYWNMGYHVEHHMFPLVPYHNLPRLHALMKYDCPKPYPNLWAAWKEMIPILVLQIDRPNLFVQRQLPPEAHPSDYRHPSVGAASKGAADAEGWIEVDAPAPAREDVLRFDHQGHTYAIYRSRCGKLHATDGICTHGSTHLADGKVIDELIECPKHNGRFDIKDGSCQRAPVCIPLKTHPVKESQGKLYFRLNAAGGLGCGIDQQHRFRVVSNENVSTFIKELILEPLSERFKYQAGEYLQLEIPAYQHLELGNLNIPSPYKETWLEQEIFKGVAQNPFVCRRNYSMASNPAQDKNLRFNVRLATAPQGKNVPHGAGSAYVFSLKAGDEVTAVGPFGDFHIKPGTKEMIYIGGGAGMAPLRSHLSTLLETQKTERKVSFWYGARSLQEVFYREVFEDLALRHKNFSFHLALSEPKASEAWQGHKGFIHQVLDDNFLKQHPQPANVEYYLCGPPPMVAAVKAMLQHYSVPAEAIACDEF